MLEPSKPKPSSKMSSVSSPVVIEKCCHIPGRSMKRRSTIFTPFSLANSTTSFGVMSGTSLPCGNRNSVFYWNQWQRNTKNGQHSAINKKAFDPKIGSKTSLSFVQHRIVSNFTLYLYHGNSAVDTQFLFVS